MEDHLRTAIIKANPIMVAVSGDLTMRGRRHEFLEAKAFLDSIPMPLVVVPGNHDVQGSWKVWERFVTPFENYQKLVSDDLDPVWRAPGIIVVGLNSARPAGVSRSSASRKSTQGVAASASAALRWLA